MPPNGALNGISIVKYESVRIHYIRYLATLHILDGSHLPKAVIAADNHKRPTLRDLIKHRAGDYAIISIGKINLGIVFRTNAFKPTGISCGIAALLKQHSQIALAAKLLKELIPIRVVYICEIQDFHVAFYSASCVSYTWASAFDASDRPSFTVAHRSQVEQASSCSLVTRPSS